MQGAGRTSGWENSAWAKPSVLWPCEIGLLRERQQGGRAVAGNCKGGQCLKGSRPGWFGMVFGCVFEVEASIVGRFPMCILNDGSSQTNFESVCELRITVDSDFEN